MPHSTPPTRRHSAKSRQSASASSGSGGSPSSHGSSRERVGKYELGSLVKAWDNDEELRGRVREKHPLLRAWDEVNSVAVDADVGKSIENCTLNAAALKPLLRLMKDNNLLLPALDRLIESIDKFYQTSKMIKSLEHCYKMAWGFRDLISTLKNLCYKPSPPTDP